MTFRLRELRDPKPGANKDEPLALPKSVLALRGCAHPELTRYAMNGVRLERADGQCRAVATDGKRLIAVEWADTTEGGGGDVDTIVPSATLAEAEKLTRGSPRAKLTDTLPTTLNSKVTISVPAKAGDIRLEAAPVAGHFPPYKDVVPGEREEFVVGLNAELLRGLALALHKATETGARPGDLSVRLRFGRAKPGEAPIVVEAIGCAGTVRGVGIIMPIHLDAERGA